MLSFSMAHDSNIVVRFEINNATARIASGRAESAEFNEGGFKWIAAVQKRAALPDDQIDFSLRCSPISVGQWNCEAGMSVYAHYSAGVEQWTVEKSFSFDGNNFVWIHKSDLRWKWFRSSTYKINNRITLEFRIRIISSNRSEPIAILSKFDAPNRRSDVILKVGDKKLHVSREFLSFHSPVFEALFFGNFAEKGEAEVEINDVIYEEFLDLLQLISFRTVEITDHTVSHILKLADRFQIEHVIDQSVKHLMQSKGIDAVKKLLIADKYNLTSLKDHCIHSFTSADLADKLKSSPESANFSTELKAELFDRVFNV